MTTIQTTFAGHAFALDNSNGGDLVAQQLANGAYEAPLPMIMMAALLRAEGHFIDVGANTGVYSVIAGKLLPNKQIMAFEPLPNVADIFRRNLQLNDLGHLVELHEIALSNTSGMANFYLSDPSHGLVETSATLEVNFQQSHSTLEVPIKRFDDVEVPYTIGVIKVDIEGHKYAFLQGARNKILRDRPIVFAEVVGPAKRAAIGAFLHSVDYLDFRLRPDMAIHDGEVMFDNSAWNHALVPAERLSTFKTICDACDLPMLRRFQLS